MNAGSEPTQAGFMSIEDFRNEGYLHETNRRFLHPLGLSLTTIHSVPEQSQIYNITAKTESGARVTGCIVVDEPNPPTMSSLTDVRWMPVPAVLLGVKDDRYDEEGMIFADTFETEKAVSVEKEWQRRLAPRTQACGWMIEPIPTQGEVDEPTEDDS